jgi:hypothetical protein
VAPSAAAVRAEVAAAEEGFRLLRLVLDGGRNPDADAIGSLPLRPAAWERHPSTPPTLA